MPILSDIDADGYFSNSTSSAYWLITRTGQLLGSTTAFISTGRITMTVEGVIAAANTGIDLLSSATTAYNQASFIYVTVNGLVSGGGNFGQGIDYFMAGSELHNAGTVMGNYAVRFTDGAEAKVFNDGIVMGVALPSGFSTGVQMLGGTGAAIVNSGLIEGTKAIDLAGTLGRIDNAGTIRGTDTGYYAIDVQANAGEFVLTNDGRIESQGLAIRATDASIKVWNTGIIHGDVQLSDLADRFNGARGELDGVLNGGGGNDILRAGRGDDEVSGGAGGDTIFGNDGDDVLNGEGGSDTIRGGDGDDVITGGYGYSPDWLYGGRGEDALKGGAGEDVLDGGADDDVLQGDKSADRFVFRRNGGDDRIVDFLDGEDIVDLSVFGFRDFTQVAALAHDTAAGLFLDLTGRNGGTVVLEGFALATFDAADVLL